MVCLNAKMPFDSSTKKEIESGVFCEVYSIYKYHKKK